MNYTPFVREPGSYKSDWPSGFRHDYQPNARQAVVVQATATAMGIMRNSEKFDGFYYDAVLDKLVMSILGIPEGHEFATSSKEFNVEGGCLGWDVYNASQLIRSKQYHEEQSAIMSSLFICQGQRIGEYKEPFGKLRRNIVINEINETGVQIYFTQGNRRYKQTVNASALEAMLKANQKDDPPVSFDESPLEALMNHL